MPAMPDETCWTLIRAAAGGSSAERQEFAERYLDAVRRYLAARWRASLMLSEVDDAVQEVFVACLKEGGALVNADPTRGQGFRAFLFGVARNVALRFERDRQRRGDRAGNHPTSEQPDDNPALSTIYERGYARAIMREAAERMAERAGAVGGAAERRVALLRLRFEDGLPVREIAKRWEVDPIDLHRESAKAGREFKAVLREVVGLAERCAPEHLERECDRLLGMLR